MPPAEGLDSIAESWDSWSLPAAPDPWELFSMYCQLELPSFRAIFAWWHACVQVRLGGKRHQAIEQGSGAEQFIVKTLRVSSRKKGYQTQSWAVRSNLYLWRSASKLRTENNRAAQSFVFGAGNDTTRRV